MKSMKKPLIASASAAFLMGLGSQAAVAENPFVAEPMSSGYTQVADNHAGGEGKCGEAKCGEKKKEKDGEGKCGEGKCGEKKDEKKEHKKDGEGKCGEGKCGA